MVTATKKTPKAIWMAKSPRTAKTKPSAMTSQAMASTRRLLMGVKTSPARTTPKRRKSRITTAAATARATYRVMMMGTGWVRSGMPAA